MTTPDSDEHIATRSWSEEEFIGYWERFLGRAPLIEDGHFAPPDDPAARAALFKRSVDTVWAEISSYCNRRCAFCPNADGGRLKKRRHLDVGLYRRVLSELRDIGYEGGFAFHEYNEPLACETVFERVAEARDHLPASRLFLTTNGDHLDPETFDRLAVSGIRHVNISIYGPDHGRFDDRAIVARMEALEDMLGLRGDWAERRTGASYVYHGRRGDVTVAMRGNDLARLGFHRADLVPALGSATRRRAPCLAPFREFHVTWQGFVKPCCNIYPDKAEHRPFVTGDLADGRGIVDHYCDQTMTAWRRATGRIEPAAPPCHACKWPWIG